MLTSSTAESDIEEALRLGIRAWCIKPSDFEDLKKLARMIRAAPRAKARTISRSSRSPARAGGPPGADRFRTPAPAALV
jgi:DNA-binding NarL/FixJ family response regulator